MKRTIALILAAALVSLNLSAQTDSTKVSNELLQKQLVSLQMSIDNLQTKLDKYEKHKDIIPSGEKSDSHFYFGFQFGLFLSHDEYSDSTESSSLSAGARFSYSVKPSIGYIFSDRLNAGIKITYSNCQFAGVNRSSIRYMIANAMMGGGISLSDYMSWKVEPYVRYRVTKVIWDKVNLWAELSAYGGQKIPRDSKTHKLNTDMISTQYGVCLRPMISCDLNNSLMLFTSFELLSWDGTCRYQNGKMLTNNSVNFQFIPFYTIATGLFHIGVLKKF